MKLTTEDRLATGGEAVARADDGRVVFVVNAAPNETVEVTIVEEKKRYLRAEVSSVITPSPSRVEPECRHFDTCGGCVLQHVDAATQTRLKDAAALETIARLGKIDVATIDHLPPWSGEAYGYRSRARFALAPAGVVGYRAKKSHSVVDVEECPILTPAAARGLAALRGVHGGGSEVREVSVISTSSAVLADDPVNAAALNEHDVRSTPGATLEADDDRGLLLLSPRVFAQANAEGNVALVDQVAAWVEALSPKLVVELYAGSGNLTRTIAPHADRVIAIEQSAGAAELSRRVAQANVDVWSEPVESGMARIEEAVSVVVLDPPRRGLSEEALAGVVGLGASHLVYVSCDPGTFARDVALLAESEYTLQRVRTFDLYPHTTHLELIGVFAR